MHRELELSDVEAESGRILPATYRDSDSGLVSVLTSPNPLQAARIESTAPEGLTVAEILALQGFPLDGPYHAIVLLDGDPVPESDLYSLRPVAGQYISANIVPHGGDGKSFLSILIGIFLVVASIYGGGGIMALTGGELFGALAGVASGLLGIAGGIISLVAPPPTVPFAGDIPTAQKSHAITGTRNAMRPYEPIPTVYGTYRMYPAHLAKPFTEIVGNDIYLRLLLTFGYGPLDFEAGSLKIGETDVINYDLSEGTDYNLHKGYDDDAALTIFTDDVSENSLDQITLEELATGNLPMTPGPYWTVTTEQDSQEVSVDFVFPGGLISISDSNGAPIRTDVYIHIQYQPKAEASGWVDAVATNELGDGVSATALYSGNYLFSMKERGRIIRGIRFDVDGAENGQYDVRIRRTTTVIVGHARDDFGSGDVKSGVPPAKNQQHSMTWAMIRSIKPYAGATLNGISKLEMRIKATDRLSGMVDTVNAVCTSVLPKHRAVEGWGSGGRNIADYNVNVFPTSNPAWIFADILRGRQNSRAAADDQMDSEAIRAWAADCDDGTLGGVDDLAAAQKRTFNAVVDFPVTVRKLLDDVAGSARASFNIVDAMYSVVVDQERSSIIQHFTPRNSSNFTGKKIFRRKAEAMRVNFINPERGYQPDEVLVFNDGFSEDGNEIHRWNFNGSTDGWTSGVAVTNTSANSYLISTTSGGTPVIYSPDSLNFDGSIYTKIRLTLRKDDVDAASTWNGRFYWQTTAGGEDSFTVDRCERPFPTEPRWSESVGGYVSLEIDMSSFLGWTTKTIKRIRFDFFNPGTIGDVMHLGHVSIDDGTQPATEYASLDLWGCTDPVQAYRDGRYHIASATLRPEVYSLDTDIEHLACTRGDLVRVTHDTMAVGLGGARFESVETSGGNFDGGVLDTSFVFDGMNNYAIHIRQEDGNEIYVPIDNPGNESKVVDATTPVAYTGTAPQAGDLVLFGEAGKNSDTYIVNRISPRQDLAATLELIDYHASVYDPGPIPAFESNTSTDVLPTFLEPAIPVIDGITSDESVMVFSGGAPVVRMVIDCHVEDVSTVSVTHIAANYRIVEADGTALGGWLPVPIVEHRSGSTQISITSVETNEYYMVRLRSISSENNVASDWIESAPHLVVGGNALPPDVSGLELRGDLKLTWIYQDSPVDHAGFRVKAQPGSDTTWATGRLLHDGLVDRNDFQLRGVAPYTNVTLMVKAVDFFGNESENAKFITVDLNASALDMFLRKSQSIRDDATTLGAVPWDWADPLTLNRTFGTVISGGAIDLGDNEYIKATTESVFNFWSVDALTFWNATDSMNFWGENTYEECSVTFWWGTDNYANLPVKVFMDLDITASSYEVEYTWWDNDSYDVSQFKVWPGEVAATIPHSDVWSLEYIQIRITMGAGSTQGILRDVNMHAYKDAITELLVEQTSPTTGYFDVHAACSKPFLAIKSVQVDIEGSGGGTDEIGFPVLQRAAAGGHDRKRLRIYGWNGTQVARTFDATVRGY